MRKKLIALLGTLILLSISLPAALAADSVTYTYDALGRLIQVTYANGTTIIYNYDAAGNRKSVVIHCASGGC
jgi:YD repeat-containing protein